MNNLLIFVIIVGKWDIYIECVMLGEDVRNKVMRDNMGTGLKG